MLLTNLNVATMLDHAPYGLIRNAAILIDGQHISWVGPAADAPNNYSGPEKDLDGRLVTPALIDCHTHVVHGGNRAAEFEMRLAGASYEEIALSGGGIASTVRQTRGASEDELLSGALRFVDALIAEGVGTIEIKSGYGLELESELKMLKVARSISSVRNVRIRTSFLAAHAVPDEFVGRPDDYINEVCLPALDAAVEEGLVDAVDGFCEGIAFSPEQIEVLFRRARHLGLPVKLHAEQLSHCGGTQQAAFFRALSADHLEHANESDVRALAGAGCVAVLLPGAFYTLRDQRLPPVDLFRAQGVPLAVATDCNPGSSPLASILLAMNMSCTLFRLTPEEALRGVTINAARALGLTDCGHIEAGKRADLAVWDIVEPCELAYRIGFNPLNRRIIGGEL